jgi:hypothetical protein
MPFSCLLNIERMHTTAKGGHMKSSQDPPPPPLAADVSMSSLQCQLAVENICVATSHLLSLIRTLRLSLLLTDEDSIEAEQEIKVAQAEKFTQEALKEAVRLEEELMEQLKKSIHQ